MADEAKKTRWRIGFREQKADFLIMTQPTEQTAEYHIEDLKTATLRGLDREVKIREHASLILVQEVPLRPTPDRIRFCPFCGYPFDDREAPEWQSETECDDCHSTIEVHLYDREEDEGDDDNVED